VQADLACAEFREQWRVAVEGLEIARHGRQLDCLCRRVQEDAVRRYETDGEKAGLWCICHRNLRG
jgi:hypothetical protein